MTRNPSAHNPTVPSVRRDHRINRPQNPYDEANMPPTPLLPEMEFSDGTTMIFSGIGTDMEYTQ